MYGFSHLSLIKHHWMKSCLWAKLMAHKIMSLKIIFLRWTEPKDTSQFQNLECPFKPQQSKTLWSFHCGKGLTRVLTNSVIHVFVSSLNASFFFLSLSLLTTGDIPKLTCMWQSALLPKAKLSLWVCFYMPGTCVIPVTAWIHFCTAGL